jgi:hypothetical protein
MNWEERHKTAARRSFSQTCNNVDFSPLSREADARKMVVVGTLESSFLWHIKD